MADGSPDHWTLPGLQKLPFKDRAYTELSAISIKGRVSGARILDVADCGLGHGPSLLFSFQRTFLRSLTKETEAHS